MPQDQSDEPEDLVAAAPDLAEREPADKRFETFLAEAKDLRPIRHEVDGLLFDVGDHGRLAAMLNRWVTEPGLQARLAVAPPGVPPVRDVMRDHCTVHGIGLPEAA
jgi:hypothetical protein